MTKATIRDLRYHFDRVETLLQQGDEVLITRRDRVVARLLPAPSSSSASPVVPDFAARLRSIYGRKFLRVSGAALLAEERSRS